MSPEENFDIVSDLGENGEASLPAVDTPSQSEPRTDEQSHQDGKTAPSLRDQLSSALKATEDTPANAQQDGGRVRDPATGKFVSAAQTPTSDQPAAQTAQPGAAQVPQGLQISADVFASLPAETQAQLARTMEYVNSRAGLLQSLEPLEQLIAPRREAWRINGWTEDQAVGQLFALSDYATRDPAGFIQYFANQSGIDLEDLVFGEDENPVDPNVAALQEQVAQMQQMLHGNVQQQQQQQHGQVVNQVLAFLDETNENGELLRPYASDIGNDYLEFIRIERERNPGADMRTVLQKAYDRACWANDSVREKMQAASAAAAKAEQLRQAAERANKARSAGVSPASGTPSSSAAVSSPASGNLRETIRAAMHSA